MTSGLATFVAAAFGTGLYGIVGGLVFATIAFVIAAKLERY